MNISNYLAKSVLDSIFGSGSPATLYFGLHLATQLSSSAASGQNQISVPFAIPVGSTVVLNPGGANAETRTVSARSGSGPYTVTLNANLSSAHASNENVKFDPLPDGSGLNPPSGGSYARVAVTNNSTNFPAATDISLVSTKKNGTNIVFPAATADWGYATHFTIHDASSGGNLLFASAITDLNAAPQIMQVLNGDQPRFPANNFVETLQ